MKQLLLFVVLISALNLYGQDTSYSRIYEPVVGTLNTNEIPLTDTDLVWDEGLLTSGRLNYQDVAFIARISPNGDLIWQRQLGSELNSREVAVNQVISTTDSCFIVAGITLDTLSDDYFPLCMKLNSMGDTLWTKIFDLPNQPIGNFGAYYSRNGAVVQNSDSTLLFGFDHRSYDQSASNPDHLCLVEITLDGNIGWTKSYETESAFHLSALKTFGDTTLYAVGKTLGTLSNGFLVNLSMAGDFQWAKKYVGIQLSGLETDMSHLYMGWTNDSFEGGVIKLMPNGEQVKRVRSSYDINFDWREMSICRRSNGNIVSTAESPHSNQPGSFVEMDSNLNLVGSYGPWMTMDEVINIPNKGIYVIGYGPIHGVKAEFEEVGVIRLDSTMTTNDCVWDGSEPLVSIDTVSSLNSFLNPSGTITTIQLPIHVEAVDFISDDGCVTSLGSVDEIAGSWNETISPNPSTGEFTIDWSEYRDAELLVYNALGAKVYEARAKNSFVDVDLRSAEDGVYYYQLLDSDGSQSSGKLVVMK